MLAPLKCPTGKTCFRSESDAVPYLAVTASKNHPKLAEKLTTYTCVHCGFVHIGHNFGPVGKRRARRGKHRKPDWLKIA